MHLEWGKQILLWHFHFKRLKGAIVLGAKDYFCDWINKNLKCILAQPRLHFNSPFLKRKMKKS